MLPPTVQAIKDYQDGLTYRDACPFTDPKKAEIWRQALFNLEAADNASDPHYSTPVLRPRT